MFSYIIQRTIQIVPTALFVLTVVFFLLSVLPGDAALLSGSARRGMDEAALENLREEWGLDDPIPIRYIKYIANLLQGDLGLSYRTGEEVSQLLIKKLAPTFSLVGLAFLFATPFGILLGFFSALNRGSIIDLGSMLFAVVGVSAPRFWVGLMLMYLFAVVFQGLLPPSGFGGFTYYILPSLTLGFPMIALIARITRSSVLEVMQEDYVRTARAKGAPESLVNLKHVFRNSILPVLTTAGLNFGAMVANTVVVEKIFSWPGIGNLVISSILRRDIPAMQGCILVFVMVVVFINALVDILYAYFDPTITYS